MAKHLTPIVGLAVVMALALAAVFGSMSLANPAMAQDPPDDTVTIYGGLNKVYDAGPLFADVTKASGVNDGDISAEQSPTGVLETSSLTNRGDSNEDDDGTFMLDDAGTFAAGVTMKTVTVTFSLNHDADADTDAIEKTLRVTIMPSDDASRATTGSGDETRHVDIGMMNTEGESAANDGTITGDGPGLVTLYTGDTMDVDVGKAFDSGDGEGEILGYSVVATAGSNFEVMDKVTMGTSHSSVHVGADGMASLEAGDSVTDPEIAADGTANLTVTAYCAAVDGSDTLTTTNCADSAVAVTAIVNVKAHTEAQRVGNIEAQVIDVGETDSIDVSDGFKDGNGSDGAIVAYSASSGNPEVVVAYYDTSTEMVVIRGLKEGGALVTVTAVDNVNADDNPTQIISVVVIEPDAPSCRVQWKCNKRPRA